jgi:hypothetical protein
MHGPSLVAWLLVALSAAAAVSCLARDEARGEAVMGAGMAVMALPVSVLDPRSWVAPVFAVVYALAALHALRPAGRAAGHRLHHVVCSAAMVYMAVSLARTGPAGEGHAMRMGAGTPVLTGLLLLYFAVYVLRTGVRLVTVPAPAGLIPGGAGPVRLRSAPEVAVACRVSMALGMLAMLMMV